MDSDIKIGFIGFEYEIDAIKTVLNNFPNINGVFHEANLEAKSHLEQNQLQIMSQDVEAMVFGNQHLFKQAIDDFTFDVPTFVIPRSLASILLSIMSLDMNSQKKIVIDELTDKQIERINQQQFFRDVEFSQYDSNKTYSEMAYLLASNIHIDVSDTLVVHPFQLHESDIVNCIERALLSSKSRLKVENNVAVCFIKVPNFNNLDKCVQDKVIDEINKLSKVLKGVLYLEDNQWIIVTQRSLVESLTLGYKVLQILHIRELNASTCIHVGFGFAKYADAAYRHAIIAMRQCKNYKESIAYFVREDQTVFGPLKSHNNELPEKFPTLITDENLITLSDKLGVSASYFMKIKSQLEALNVQTLTAMQLRNMMGVSLRSANRILLKWEDCGIVTVVGEEKLQRKGRPRRLYKISV